MTASADTSDTTEAPDTTQATHVSHEQSSPAQPTGLPRLSAGDRAREIVYKYGLLIVLAALIVWFASARPAFATYVNALTILQSVAIVAIVALGQTVSMTVDGFDLSVGSNVSFTVMVTAAGFVYWGLGTVPAILLGLAAGTAVGLVNALLIVVARIPDMLATLGTMFTFAGLSLLVSAGQSISSGSGYSGSAPRGELSDAFLRLGQGRLAGVPIPVLVMAVVAVVVWVFLERSRSGRLLRAVGANPEAARLAGANTGRQRALAYVISAFLASVGGVLLTARLGRGDVNVGSDYLLECVAAALIGFAVLGANRPNALGTIVGALFVGIVLNGLTMFNAPYYLQDFIEGVLLLGALVLSFSPLFNRKEVTS